MGFKVAVVGATGNVGREILTTLTERDFPADDAAIVEYQDGEFRIVKPGAYVVCAVTGAKIPLEALRYWSVDLQEAYASPAVALKRLQEKGLTPK